ncbi:hypothetical protein LUD75_15400 [Epilithonimonas sp. JDS]|nr:hypothetical protein [Epilithonimonas sp. JDS]MCD9856111.1 hypothetical protein [Epilithonimonas sp. JDS]
MRFLRNDKLRGYNPILFYSENSQPDLSGALFWIGKGLAKKAGTEGG